MYDIYTIILVCYTNREIKVQPPIEPAMLKGIELGAGVLSPCFAAQSPAIS